MTMDKGRLDRRTDDVQDQWFGETDKFFNRWVFMYDLNWYFVDCDATIAVSFTSLLLSVIPSVHSGGVRRDTNGRDNLYQMPYLQVFIFVFFVRIWNE